MTKLVVLKLDGNLQSGFKVNVEIFLRDRRFYGRRTGELSRNLKLLDYLSAWQAEYRNTGNSSRIKGKKVVVTSTHAKSKLHFWGERLCQEFQQWLKGEEFQDINLWLREKLSSQEYSRILLCTNSHALQQLPWNEWDFIKRYPRAEIALSPLDITEVAYFKAARKSEIKILAILGSSDCIDVAKDLEILATLKHTYLEPLIEPSREFLYDRLWSESWDIVFFAGHSETIADRGTLYLNSEDILTIDDLTFAFQKAISNGLQLAIFNSCDGLGLARALARLGLPQAIVMREPIIDFVAQKFLGYFLLEYQDGQPLHLATRKARERLQALEDRYPYSSWLPVLYQNQSATPPLWSEFVAKDSPSFSSDRKKKFNYLALIAISAIATGIVWWCQAMGWLQAGELNNYDRALRWKPATYANDKVLVITVEDRDIAYQTDRGMTMRGSLADEALAQLLTKLKPHQPIAIASDIIHDFAYTPQLKQIVTRQDNFVAICRVKNEESNLSSIDPPPEIASENLGFTNLAIDNDGVIRRYILGMSPDTRCQSNLSLSLRMALKYLDYYAKQNLNKPIYPRELTNSYLKIGATIFHKIEFDSGAYQLPKAESRGYQVLLDRAATSPTTVSLREILTAKSDLYLSKLIKDKVIFIGVKSHNNDLHYTPYSNKQQARRVPGVLIHALATDHIINAALERQKLLRWLPNQLELLWIFAWSIIGSLTVAILSRSIRYRQKLFLVIAVTIAGFSGLIYLSYFGLLIAGYWLPLISAIAATIIAISGTLSVVGVTRNSSRNKA